METQHSRRVRMQLLGGALQNRTDRRRIRHVPVHPDIDVRAERVRQCLFQFGARPRLNKVAPPVKRSKVAVSDQAIAFHQTC